MRSRFDEISAQILHGLWEEDPVEATYLGVHAYDSVLPRADPDSRASYSEQRSNFLRALEEFQDRREELDSERKLDLDLLRSELEVSLRVEDEFRPAERRADAYPSNALYGVYLPAMRQFAPLEERLVSIRDRLLDTPRYLREGIENLRNGNDIPHIWSETGLQMAESGAGLYTGMIPELARQVPSLEKELDAAAATAARALADYNSFIKHDLLPRSDGRFAIGRDAFDFLLSRKHHLPYDALDLRQLGEEILEETQRSLDRCAEKIGTGEEWPELVARLKDDHPRADELLDEYRRQMERARRFVEENDIVTIPTGQELQVVETPPFERATIPYAAYVPPAAFEERQEGFFWVTPAADAEDEARREELLRGHCRWGIPITALHEGFPGHHLQFCHANTIESAPRRMLMTTVFVEGWALYCEEMMEEQGFLDDPRHHLLRLKDQLWRACRVLIDVGLHCFDMSFEEAVEMLVSVAKLERPNAEAEVKRYTMTPTQPMSYMRYDMQTAEGGEFNLRLFHDRLLSFGAIPVALIKGEMLAGA